MQTFSNHDSLLNVFEMDDIDPIDIFEDRTKSASMLADMPTKPSRFSTPDTQEDEMAQLRRESAKEKESLDLGITSSSVNTAMIETVKSENEMLVSTPRIEVRISSFFRIASQKHLPSLAFVRVFICDMCCTKASFYRLCTRLKALFCFFLLFTHSHYIFTHVLFFTTRIYAVDLDQSAEHQKEATRRRKHKRTKNQKQRYNLVLTVPMIQAQINSQMKWWNLC